MEVAKPEAPVEAPVVPLTAEERADLRKFVLGGGKLSVEEARRVYETLRSGQAAVAAGESKKKTRSKKPAMSDAELDADLASLGVVGDDA